MMYPYILFDLDGTLTKSHPGIVNSVSYALGKLGIPVEDREELKKFIGPPLTDSLMRFYGVTEEMARQGVVYYREYYTDRGIYENALYDGVREMLETLKAKGAVLAVATSKPEAFAVRIADHFKIAQYFTGIFGASMDGSRIEKEDVIRYALEGLNISGKDKKKVLMAGDRKHDILGARKNRIASMGVLYGYGSRSELMEAGADYIAASPWEAAAMIINNRTEGSKE